MARAQSAVCITVRHSFQVMLRNALRIEAPFGHDCSEDCRGIGGALASYNCLFCECKPFRRDWLRNLEVVALL